MKRWLAVLAPAALAASLLAGCERAPTASAAPPAPFEVSAQATGHYCGMLLAEHEGPKGQIHLSSRDQPVWFTSVRDTVAFLRLPEEARDIEAVYVNDMGRAKNWTEPERGTWVDPRQAWFVIESTRRGGMGAPEAVPFSDEAAAESFRAAHGGKVVRLDGIPDAYVLGPVNLASAGHEQGSAAAKQPAEQSVQAAQGSDPGHPGHSEHSGHSGHSSR
jgi:copper chaperone NosL